MQNLHLKHFEYNTRLDINYRLDPKFEITDAERKKSVFGDSVYSYTGDNNIEEKVKLFTNAGDSAQYHLGYPVFTKDNKYTWKIYAYEKYVNADGDKVDLVPLSNAVISIDNALSSNTVYIDRNDSLGNNISELTLDSLGMALYRFQVGFPNFSNDHLLSAKITYNNQGKTVSWRPDTNPFKAIIS